VRWLLVALLLTLPACPEIPDLPEPTPTPTPSPTPTPEPTPEPTPTPTPPPVCDLEGRPQARVYWYQGQRTADATPAVCQPGRCNRLPCYVGRYCCPVTCEDDPLRGPCEEELMGGELPVWELTVTEGNLRRANGPGEWKFIVRGAGKGYLRWCFPNGKACSRPLSVDR
jgi:hypothetical protein